MRFFQSSERAATTADLDSVYINACFSSSGQEECFIKRYYPVDIWGTDGAAFDAEAQALRVQLSTDFSDRQYDANCKAYQSAKLAIFFGALVSTIAFVRTILGAEPEHQSTLKYIAYAEVGFGLLFAMSTQLIDKRYRVHMEAANHLHQLFTWFQYYEREKKQASNTQPTPYSIRGVTTFNPRVNDATPIKNQLIAMNYKIFTQASQAKHSIETLTRQYTCPIIVINEIPTSDEAYCQIIHETTFQNKAIESKENRTTKTPQTDYVLFYRNQDNAYQQVLIPTSRSTFALVKDNLMRFNLQSPTLQL